MDRRLSKQYLHLLDFLRVLFFLFVLRLRPPERHKEQNPPCWVRLLRRRLWCVRRRVRRVARLRFLRFLRFLFVRVRFLYTILRWRAFA